MRYNVSAILISLYALREALKFVLGLMEFWLIWKGIVKKQDTLDTFALLVENLCFQFHQMRKERKLLKKHWTLSAW